jgi:hypothetical protein
MSTPVLDEVSVTRSATSHETSLQNAAPDSITSASLRASRSLPAQNWGSFQGRRPLDSVSPAVDLSLQHGLQSQPQGIPETFSGLFGGHQSSRSQSPWQRTPTSSQLNPSWPSTPDKAPPALLQACAAEAAVSASLGNIALAAGAMDPEAMGTGTDSLPETPRDAVLMAAGASYACVLHSILLSSLILFMFHCCPHLLRKQAFLLVWGTLR